MNEIRNVPPRGWVPDSDQVEAWQLQVAVEMFGSRAHVRDERAAARSAAIFAARQVAGRVTQIADSMEGFRDQWQRNANDGLPGAEYVVAELENIIRHLRESVIPTGREPA